MLYLDHNATTPLDERVMEAMSPYLKTIYGNPSSLYRLGRIARSALDTAREQIASLVDAEPGQIIFTSGGAEANALALANAGNGSIHVSAIEHPTVLENARARNNPIFVINVDKTGIVNADTLNILKPRRGDFVSIMLANNETGAIQDLAGITEQLAGLGVNIHTDAVQALGKIPVSFKELGVNLMTLSSHKIYGPKGCGALVFEKNFQLKAWLRGGDQEQGFRAGTENVAAIAGFGKAAELAKLELTERSEHLLSLRNKLEKLLSTISGLSVFAENTPRLPNTVQFGIEGVNGQMLLMQLDKNDIAVSSGSACSAHSVDPSPVLNAMGVAPCLARSAIRVSLGKDNHEGQIDAFVQTLKNLLPHST